MGQAVRQGHPARIARPAPAGQGEKSQVKYPPYASQIAKQRQDGAVFGLLVLATGWEAGQEFGGNDQVARVVVPDELDLAALRWNFLAGLDVLVMPDSATPDARYMELILAADAAGANSVWAEFERGVHRVFCTGAQVFCQQGPIPLAQLALAVGFWRRHQLLAAIGPYAEEDWDDTRRDLVAQVEAALACRISGN